MNTSDRILRATFDIARIQAAQDEQPVQIVSESCPVVATKATTDHIDDTGEVVDTALRCDAEIARIAYALRQSPRTRVQRRGRGRGALWER